MNDDTNNNDVNNDGLGNNTDNTLPNDNLKTYDDYFTLFKNTDSTTREGEPIMDENNNFEKNTTEDNNMEQREMPTASIPSTPPAPQVPTPPQAPPPQAQTAAPRYIDSVSEPPHTFVSENIKSQKNKKNPFKTFILGICVLTTICVFAFAGVKCGEYLYDILHDNVVAANSNQDEKIDENDVPVENFSENYTPLKAYDVSDVVKEVSQSVVSINIEATHETIFNQAITSSGAGSGVIFMEDAENIYVATNNHVIQGASSVTISLDDEIQVPAHSVGNDAKSDLAVISVAKVDMATAGMTDYEVAKIGNSDELEVGDTAIAIGNALGEGKSATLGIVSAKDKKINIDGKELNVIQTDAAINAGNSGGALVNSQGEVIGINTAKLASAGVEGMGYSIPTNDAKIIVNEIMTTGTVARPYLGISGSDITPEAAEMFGVPAGVYVANVMPGSGAAEAGIKTGDVIIGYGDEKIESMEELQGLIASSTVGETVKVAVWRDGSIPLILDVPIKNMNEETQF